MIFSKDIRIQTKKPNLFLIGKPKSGTTALHYFLLQHPDVFMSKYKEPLHFAKDFYEESFKFHKRTIRRFKYVDVKAYLDLFACATAEKVIGESTTHYIHSNVAAKEIYEFNPDSKIIIILREPVDFLYSYHSELFAGGNEDIEDFKEALRMERFRRKGRNIPRAVIFPSLLFYSDKVKYAEHVANFTNIFPSQNLSIVFFDDFQKNNAHVYKNILKFLNIDENFVPEFEIHNPNEQPRSQKLNAFIRNSNIIGFLQNALPYSVYNKIRLVGKNVLLQRVKRQPLDPSFRKTLMGKFKPEVEKLCYLLDMDLVEKWRYDQV